jgi:predicted SnoaL-like aldol condensation-catalyzing enzyme
MATTTTPSPRLEQSEEAEANRQIAVDFLTEAGAGRAQEAMRRYAAPDFVHHNPYFASDADTLARAMDENARENPDKQVDILRTIADGPLVAIHGRVRHKLGDDPVALVHIFRIDGGRIRELWDLGQEPVPGSPNRAGLF